MQNLEEESLKQKMEVRDMKNFKLEIFSIDLDKIELIHFFKTSNLNEMYNRFHQKLLNTINKNAPQKTMSNKEMKFQTTPWIDKNILHKIIEKKQII